MASPLPSASSDQELGVGEAERPHLSPEVGLHRWVSYIPYGGSFLLICACEYPGPFVMDLNDRWNVQCGIALAWWEGVSRLALCSGREVERLPVTHE